MRDSPSIPNKVMPNDQAIPMDQTQEFLVIWNRTQTDYPHPDAHQQPENGFVLPRTDVEKRIASVWCEILRTEKVGIFDNFFDLGGHSFKSMDERVGNYEAF